MTNSLPGASILGAELSKLFCIDNIFWKFSFWRTCSFICTAISPTCLAASAKHKYSECRKEWTNEGFSHWNVDSLAAMGDYRYHELRPLISYFPCHWVVPVDFPNTCPMKIVRIFYRINARSGHDFNTLTRLFPNQQWYNKPTHDLVERLLFPLSFYRRYIKFRERYSNVSKFQMTFIWARFTPF